MKKVYVLYSDKEIGCFCYESKTMAEIIAENMSKQFSQEWKVKELNYTPNPF